MGSALTVELERRCRGRQGSWHSSSSSTRSHFCRWVKRIPSPFSHPNSASPDPCPPIRCTHLLVRGAERGELALLGTAVGESLSLGWQVLAQQAAPVVAMGSGEGCTESPTALPSQFGGQNGRAWSCKGFEIKRGSGSHHGDQERGPNALWVTDQLVGSVKDWRAALSEAKISRDQHTALHVDRGNSIPREPGSQLDWDP